MPHPWWAELRALNDLYFAGTSHLTWDKHVSAINERFGLNGVHALRTFPKSDLPPSWFIGDLTSVQPDDWILVLSLNPAWDRSDPTWYTDRTWDAEAFWNFQLNVVQSWNRSFHGSLTQLALIASGYHPDELDGISAQEYARSHLVFAELCPYSSEQFYLERQVLSDLYANDVGFHVEASFVDQLLKNGKPRMVFVHGSEAIANFATLYNDRLDWNSYEYLSVDKATKKLWHMAGTINVQGKHLPVAGFPFLRKPRTHNSKTEIDQLGHLIHQTIEAP
jgi:hypothetical protein